MQRKRPTTVDRSNISSVAMDLGTQCKKFDFEVGVEKQRPCIKCEPFHEPTVNYSCHDHGEPCEQIDHCIVQEPDEMIDDKVKINEGNTQPKFDYLTNKTVMMNQLLLEVLKDNNITKTEQTNLVEKINELTHIIQTTMNNKQLQQNSNETIQDQLNNNKLEILGDYQDGVNNYKQMEFDCNLMKFKDIQFQNKHKENKIPTTHSTYTFMSVSSEKLDSIHGKKEIKQDSPKFCIVPQKYKNRIRAKKRKKMITRSRSNSVESILKNYYDDSAKLTIFKLKRRLQKKTAECILLNKNINTLKTKIKILEGSTKLGESKLCKRLLSCNELISYQKDKISDLKNVLKNRTSSLIRMKDSLGKLKAANAGRETAIIRFRELLNKYSLCFEKHKNKEHKLERCCEKLKSEFVDKNSQLNLLNQKIEELNGLNEELEKNFQKMCEENNILRKTISNTETNLIDESSMKNKIKHLKKIHLDNMLLASVKLTKANTKIKELFTTIEMFIRRVHTILYSEDIMNTIKHCKEEISRINSVCSILQLDHGEIRKVLTTGKIPETRRSGSA